jgi:hypothetical protein
MNENFVQLAKNAWKIISNDKTLNSKDVAMYLGLFFEWNKNHWNNPFYISRNDLHIFSKVGKNSHSESLRRLQTSGYIAYQEGINKEKPAIITMLPLANSADVASIQTHKHIDTPSQFSAGNIPQTMTSAIPETGTIVNNKHLNSMYSTDKKNKERNTKKLLVKTENQNIHFVPNMNAPSFAIVREFFIRNVFPEDQALKFFQHNNQNGWKLKNGQPLGNWMKYVFLWMGKIGMNPDPDNIFLKCVSDLDFLYALFLKTELRFTLIEPSHFFKLKLVCNDGVRTKALDARKNILIHSNIHSNKELYLAYISGDSKNSILMNDKCNLERLEQQFTVIEYFKELRQNSVQNLPIPN